MGAVFSVCFGHHSGTHPQDGERRPLLGDPTDQEADDGANAIPSYIQEEEALKRIVQKACESFIDISSATMRISDKLSSDLPPPSNILVNVPVNIPVPGIVDDALVQVSPVDPNSDEARAVMQTTARLVEALKADVGVKYTGQVVVPLV
ncbi:hypothetical protein BCR44DRAFT_1424351 [Catenaria anguillulae PL171]|uniref:Uncharacterized protein n=1 Tax=Catenaria anguillulae PL171 TaxID=765915 RepID=A0A1Y2I2J7_9FUNG|nr:hypothetical protein BCR44DRAFT_1424351 [Catenaria anguillulae PL171]